MQEDEYTPAEDSRFDQLTDYMNAAEAREIIRLERESTLGHEVMSNTVSLADRPKKTHYSRRGGRSYPEMSDSEADPHWNVQGASEQVLEDEATREAYLRFTHEAHDDAIAGIAKEKNITLVEATALLKAKKEIKRRKA